MTILQWSCNVETWQVASKFCQDDILILKFVCPEQYQKAKRNKGQHFGCILFLKKKFSFDHYKIC